ncbi:hypothetical protein [uncultured Anaerotruncus sp.]|uniref:hypothetical protein n=1 Tax=uncultured Anaerotruncus sp. TaxID=905011 RepID=UPI00280C248F|nr:hypothetical protein [uncultured Anaerotruncus sp.]
MAPKGKTMLKVVSILYIIFSGISILLGLLALVGGGMIAAGGDMMGAGVGAVAAIAGVVLIASSVFSLIVGIIGVKNCAKPEKAQVCFVLGIILIVLAAFSLISSFGGDGNVFSALVGLVLPVLYTLGAYWNKQSAAALSAPQAPSDGADQNGPEL